MRPFHLEQEHSAPARRLLAARGVLAAPQALPRLAHWAAAPAGAHLDAADHPAAEAARAAGDVPAFAGDPAADDVTTTADAPPAAVRHAFMPPRIVCGRCHQELDELPVGRHARCPWCARRIDVPPHVHIACAQCGRSHAIRPAELRVERLCANCGRPLPVGPIVVSPPRRRHATRAPSRRAGAHGDAAWAVLIVGLTVLVFVLSLTVW